MLSGYDRPGVVYTEHLDFKTSLINLLRKAEPNNHTISS